MVLPGPPKEMEAMMEHEVLHTLLREYSNMILLTKTLEIRGIPEGILDEQIFRILFQNVQSFCCPLRQGKMRSYKGGDEGLGKRKRTYRKSR